MARKSNAAKKKQGADAQNSNEQPASVAPGIFVLKKNHGLTVRGRASKFYEAGTTFDPATDGDLIFHLVQSGAQIVEVIAEVEPVQESAEPASDDPENDQSDAQE